MSPSSDEVTLVAKEIGKTELARFGKAKLMAFALRLTPDATAKRRLEDASHLNAQTTTQRLLIDSDETERPYISLDEAHLEYGINKDTLVKLCEDGTVESKEENGDWSISRASLRLYLETSQSDE